MLMFDRLPMQLMSIRNRVLRTVAPKLAYNPKQIAVAYAMYTVLAAEHDDDSCAVILACCDGECSFDLTVGGDKVKGQWTAKGGFQWHQPRRGDILKYLSIDVWNASPEDTARAFLGETSKAWPGNIYHRVGRRLKAAGYSSITTSDQEVLEAKMTVLVTEFERSEQEERDIARRTPLAVFWRQYMKDHWTRPAALVG